MKFLEKNNFTLYENVADIFSKVAEFVIPRGRVVMFPTDKNIKLFLPCKDTFTGLTGGADNEVSLSNDMVDPPVIPDDGGAVKGLGATVAYETTSATPAIVVAKNHDYSLNKVTLEMPAGKTEAKVYYLWGDAGTVEIRIENPIGNLYRTIFSAAIRDLHTREQFKSNLPFRLSDIPNVPFPEDFKLCIYVESAIQITKDSDALNHQIGIPYKMLTLEQYLAQSRIPDLKTLVRMAEDELNPF